MITQPEAQFEFAHSQLERQDAGFCEEGKKGCNKVKVAVVAAADKRKSGEGKGRVSERRERVEVDGRRTVALEW
jgi:hypothetical protein